VFDAFITRIWALVFGGLVEGLSPLGKSVIILNVALVKRLMQSGLLHRIASLAESAALEDFNMA